MSKLKILFEKDPALDHIEVKIRAREQDAEVSELIRKISYDVPGTITVTDAEGALQELNAGEIISASVIGKQVQILTENARFTLRQPLQSFEEKLKAGRFVRISRYEIVNLDKVLKYDFTLSGTLRLELAGGMETWASRRNIPLIRRKLTEREEQ